MSSKDTNPKDAVGTKKPPMSTVSGPVLMEIGVGMLEGARKYGRHNYRVSGVRASVYYDAAKRHLIKWWEGEDIDPDSGLSHVTKAICSLVVIRDAMICEKCIDDRPPKSITPEFLAELQSVVDRIFEDHPEAKEAFTEAGLSDGGKTASEILDEIYARDRQSTRGHLID
ncbi:MAG: dATP/dGTP diphosphohydrolase domain-containing protein [Pseudomonadota bacterium]